MQLDVFLLRALVEILVTSWVISQREQIGTDMCRDTLMGPWRRAIGTAFPPNATGLTMPLEARGIAASGLKEICRACGGCELAPKDGE